MKPQETLVKITKNSPIVSGIEEKNYKGKERKEKRKKKQEGGKLTSVQGVAPHRV